ncbi:MAG TPA: histidine kinase [Geobacteraceae bacterium]
MERLICLGRLVLAVFFLLALLIDPSEPAEYSIITFTILKCYLIYASALAIVVWMRKSIPRYFHYLFHATDLAVFSLLMLFTDGTNSPFFVCFVFLLVCASLRWKRRGTLWTAVITLACFFAMLCYAGLVHSHTIALNRIIIRISYLAVIATMLSYLGAHEQAFQSVLAKLARWPHPTLTNIQNFTQITLAHAAEILRAPRLILVWEEEEEPWVHLTEWSSSEFRCSREQQRDFEPIVDLQLAASSFLVNDGDSNVTVITEESGGTIHQWPENPIHQQFRERFGITSVLCVPVIGKDFRGHLMAPGLRQMTTDDLVLGGIVAHEIATRLEHHILLDKLQETAILEERVRLARDLHDGVLQSLTGASLHLETAQRLMIENPQAARQQIATIQEVISVEQRALRAHIQLLKPLPAGRQVPYSALSDRLEELAGRIRRLWGIEANLATEGLDDAATPEELARDICFIVHESLINAARHAGASIVNVELASLGGELQIVVVDNGRGFPFRGRYDHKSLISLKIGPATLKERIDHLGGRLTVDSRETGARLEIFLPLGQNGE